MWTFADRRLVHSDATPESVAILRIWIFGIWTIYVLSDPLPALAELPTALFSPVGLTGLLPPPVLDAILSPAALTALKAGLVLTCLAATIGLATRFSTVLAALLIVFYQSLVRGPLGYANHSEVTLIMATVVLAVSPCGAALAVWPRCRPAPSAAACQFPLVTILGLTCVMYVFIGTFRLTHGGLELFRSDALQDWILSWSLREPDPARTLGGAWISNPFLNAVGKAGFPLLTLLEVSALGCVFSSRFRAFFIPSMLLAHLGILLLMRIDFTNQVLCYLVFIDSRHWSPARARSETSVIYFDGVCGLCNGFVDFVLARDRARRYRFAPLQGEVATARVGPAGAVDPTTILHEEDGVFRDRSAAALRIVSGLGGAWCFVAVLGLVPRPIRDAVYDWVARNRYAWFGKRDTCRLPTPEERAVFLA